MVAVDNPVLVRRYRGDQLESLHRGAWAVVDVDGEVVASAGDPEQPIFARSSSKSLQAAAVVEAGAAEQFGLDDRHLAVMISSHNAEAMHVEVVESLLAAIGLDEDALRCGAAAPLGRPDGVVRRLHHNCSGKHAGFLSGARALGQDSATYLDPDGELQRRVRAAVQRIADVPDAQLDTAVDGCSAPTFVMPLRNLALGIARIANPDALDIDAAAAASFVEAAAAHPELVAGRSPRRFDTDVLEATAGRVFAKGGADGVQVLGVRGAGVAFAGKVDDGNERGLLPVALAVLAELGHLDDAESDALASWAAPEIRNADGLVVGEQRLEPIAR